MKTRKTKLSALLLSALLHCSALFASTGPIPIALDYDPAKKEDGTHRPHRAPQNIHLSLNVSYDAEIGQLFFSDMQGLSYYYMVVDNNDNIVSGGYLDFNEQTSINISLGSQTTGNYTLIVWYGEYEFSGSF